jgi:hypothetical protein
MVAAICMPIPVKRYFSEEAAFSLQRRNEESRKGHSAATSQGWPMNASTSEGYAVEDELEEDDEVEGPEEGVEGESAASTAASKGTASPRAMKGADTEGPLHSDADDARSIFAQLGSGSDGATGSEGSSLSSDFFGAIRVPRGGSGGAGVAAPVKNATPEPNPVPWVSGQARGYTMLYAMQPEARLVTEQQVNALISAKLREVHIGVLVDGTFGQDISYLKSVIQRLSEGGRALTLVLYLSNGPTMRRWRETRMQFLFSTIEPVEFRRRIRSDKALRAQFSTVVSEARGIFDFAQSRNPDNRNIAVVMLEDNLDTDSYRTMRALASEGLGTSASFVRNPCVGCYRGNDGNSLGDAREEHALSSFPTLSAGDAYSLDGVGFSYPNSSEPSSVSSDQLLELMRACMERGLQYVGLWRHAWQGIQGSDNPPASERVYIPSDDDQLRFEIRALREGLTPEQGDSSNVDDEIDDGVERTG